MKALFYFNNLEQLSDFEAFDVKTVSVNCSGTLQEGQKAQYWSLWAP